MHQSQANILTETNQQDEQNENKIEPLIESQISPQSEPQIEPHIKSQSQDDEDEDTSDAIYLKYHDMYEQREKERDNRKHHDLTPWNNLTPLDYGADIENLRKICPTAYGRLRDIGRVGSPIGTRRPCETSALSLMSWVINEAAATSEFQNLTPRPESGSFDVLGTMIVPYERRSDFSQ